MPPELLDEMTIRRYLLGDLTEEDRLEVERRLLEDGELFDQVASIEEELIDEYVRGGLSAPERKNLEGGFLSTRQGMLLAELSINLDRCASQKASASRRSVLGGLVAPLKGEIVVPRYTLALASLAVFLIIGSFGLYIRHVQNGSRVVSGREQKLQEELDEEKARSEKLAGDLAREQQLRTNTEQELAALRSGNRNDLPTGPPAGGTLIALLFPGSTRGQGARKEIVLTASTVRVSLQLVVSGDTHDSYQVSINGGHSQQVLPDRLQAKRVGRRSVVTLNLPASRLAPGDYAILLSGEAENGQYEPAEAYSFKVVKK